MTHPQPTHTSAAARRRFIVGRRGFSFVEVLFAVMILGIGFIMIAGIFPAAISQTAATQEETVAANIGRGVASALTSVNNLASYFPADDNVHPLPLGLVNALKGNQILKEDPRFAWVAFLKRTKMNSEGQVPAFGQLIVVPVQARGRAAFDQRDLTVVNLTAANPTSPDAYGTLYPIQVRVMELVEGGDNPDEVSLEFDPGGSSVREKGPRAIAPGAVLVIAKGNDDGNAPRPPRNAAGRVYRLGEEIPDTKANRQRHRLIPGSDMDIDYGADGQAGGGGADTDLNENIITSPALGYVVGQSMVNPGEDVNNNPTFESGNMAIGVYTTFVFFR